MGRGARRSRARGRASAQILNVTATTTSTRNRSCGVSSTLSCGLSRTPRQSHVNRCCYRRRTLTALRADLHYSSVRRRRITHPHCAVEATRHESILKTDRHRTPYGCHETECQRCRICSTVGHLRIDLPLRATVHTPINGTWCLLGDFSFFANRLALVWIFLQEAQEQSKGCISARRTVMDSLVSGLRAHG